MPKIIIVKHLHASDEMLATLPYIHSESDLNSMPDNFINYFNSLARSNYHVAKYINKNKNTAVILENNDVLRHGQSVKLDRVAKINFPKGLPASFDRMNFFQKKFLCTVSGAHYAVHVGDIQQTHSDDLSYDKNRDKIRSGIETSDYDHPKNAIIDQKREYLSLENAEKISEKINKNVILVVGPAHIYKDVAQCFKIKTSFVDFFEPTYIGGDRHALEEHIKELSFYRTSVNCSFLAEGFKPLLLSSQEKIQLASAETTSVMSLLEKTPISLLIKMGFWAASKFGLYENPAPAPLAIDYSDSASKTFQEERMREQSANRKLKEKNTSLNDYLHHLFGKKYTQGTLEDKERLKKFVIHVINGDVDKDTGVKFNDLTKISKRYERSKQLFKLLKEFEARENKKRFGLSEL